ncbi:hypothetical protein PsYK624_111880 [Phanerochaete sordida]|uniref:Uncharacterized protein n=1 Tax=Phanerochaete sordida TaxID=48140 RepID=A0A9P3GK34_9APHY|nr:hypothetical protein PsYK624_111880 [Phanerochaete sordida]
MGPDVATACASGTATQPGVLSCHTRAASPPSLHQGNQREQPTLEARNTKAPASSSPRPRRSLTLPGAPGTAHHGAYIKDGSIPVVNLGRRRRAAARRCRRTVVRWRVQAPCGSLHVRSQCGIALENYEERHRDAEEQRRPEAHAPRRRSSFAPAAWFRGRR